MDQAVTAIAPRRPDWNAVTLLAIAVAVLIAVPVLVVIGSVFTPSTET